MVRNWIDRNLGSRSNLIVGFRDASGRFAKKSARSRLGMRNAVAAADTGALGNPLEGGLQLNPGG
jgi:hypothetical protein